MLLAACSNAKPTGIDQPEKPEQQLRAASEASEISLSDAVTSEEVIEELQCGEIQVAWRLTWAGREPLRRYRRADTKLRLTRTASSFSFVAPAGTILGLTPSDTNAYSGEEWERLKDERRVILNATQYAVHCLPERNLHGVADAAVPE